MLSEDCKVQQYIPCSVFKVAEIRACRAFNMGGIATKLCMRFCVGVGKLILFFCRIEWIFGLLVNFNFKVFSTF